MSYTEADYQAAIPACCSRQTLKEHMEMLLCWGLASALDEGRPWGWNDCKNCVLVNPNYRPQVQDP